MAGGDFDGDKYAVIYGENRIINAIKDTYPHGGGDGGAERVVNNSDNQPVTLSNAPNFYPVAASAAAAAADVSTTPAAAIASFTVAAAFFSAIAITAATTAAAAAAAAASAAAAAVATATTAAAAAAATSSTTTNAIITASGGDGDATTGCNQPRFSHSPLTLIFTEEGEVGSGVKRPQAERVGPVMKSQLDGRNRTEDDGLSQRIFNEGNAFEKKFAGRVGIFTNLSLYHFDKALHNEQLSLPITDDREKSEQYGLVAQKILDCQKSGEEVKLPDYKMIKPHYLMSTDNKSERFSKGSGTTSTYMSKSINGILFDAIEEESSRAQELSSSIASKGNLDEDIFKRFEGIDYFEEAKRIWRRNYQDYIDVSNNRLRERIQNKGNNSNKELLYSLRYEHRQMFADYIYQEVRRFKAKNERPSTTDADLIRDCKLMVASSIYAVTYTTEGGARREMGRTDKEYYCWAICPKELHMRKEFVTMYGRSALHIPSEEKEANIVFKSLY